ncbi:MAG: hypothetical protein Kow0099_28220 [Candidatus Abyssubacteria bacterium]
MNSGKPSLRKDLVHVLLLLITGLLYFSLLYRSVFYPPDEGSIAYQIEKCLNGELPHRDFYSVYGVGFYLLGEWLFRLFGVNLVVLRSFVVVLKLATIVLLYVVSRRFVRPSFAFLGVLIFIIWWGDPFITTSTFFYPSHISQFLGFLGLWLVFRYVESGRSGYVLWAGLAVGLGGLFKPTVTVFNIMAFLLFFFCREATLDLRDQHIGAVAERGNSLGKPAVMLEMVGVMVGASLVGAMFLRFGIAFDMLAFFLVPFALVVVYIMWLSFSALRADVGGGILWNNFKGTFRSYVFLGLGVVFWQVLQVLYFAWHGALGDFVETYRTASAYYSNYASPLMGGASVLPYSGLALLVAYAIYVAMRRTGERGEGWKMAVCWATAVVVLAVPGSFYFAQKSSLMLHHLGVAGVSMILCLAGGLFIVFRDSLKRIRGGDVVSLLLLQALMIYAVVNLLDAYPRADPGHVVTVQLPFFVLFGLLFQKFYDSCSDYLAGSGRARGVVPRLLTGALAFGLLLPSLFMMVRFNFLIVLSREHGRLRLYGDRLSRAPRMEVDFERAKGIVLHHIEGFYAAPLQGPQTKPFLETTRRIAEITRPGDRIFSTDTWGRMLYFLAERDGLSGKANDFVWQSVAGVAGSNAFPGFSDIDLTRQIERERPAAIVVNTDTLETKQFMRTWPTAWSYITHNYRLAERVYPFEIYLPVTQSDRT